MDAQRIFTTSNVAIYHGHALDVLPLLTVEVDACITDPPFGINYQNNYTRQIQDKLTGDENTFSYKEWGQQIFRLMKTNTPLFTFTGWSEYPHHYQELESCGFRIKEPLIIQKRASGKTDLYGSFQSNADWLIFAHKGRFRFRKTQLVRNKKAGVIPNKGRKPVPEFKTRFPSCWFGESFPWSTENPASVRHYKHPTIKSVALMRWLILLSTNENDLIIDPFMGSGTTLVAASQLNRKAIGIEINEEYCKLAISRLKSSL